MGSDLSAGFFPAWLLPGFQGHFQTGTGGAGAAPAGRRGWGGAGTNSLFAGCPQLRPFLVLTLTFKQEKPGRGGKATVAHPLKMGKNLGVSYPRAIEAGANLIRLEAADNGCSSPFVDTSFHLICFY